MEIKTRFDPGDKAYVLNSYGIIDEVEVCSVIVETIGTRIRYMLNLSGRNVSPQDQPHHGMPEARVMTREEAIVAFDRLQREMFVKLFAPEAVAVSVPAQEPAQNP